MQYSITLNDLQDFKVTSLFKMSKDMALVAIECK